VRENLSALVTPGVLLAEAEPAAAPAGHNDPLASYSTRSELDPGLHLALFLPSAWDMVRYRDAAAGIPIARNFVQTTMTKLHEPAIFAIGVVK